MHFGFVLSVGDNIADSVIKIAQVKQVISDVFGRHGSERCIDKDWGFTEFIAKLFPPSDTVV